jgi:hypothetical protein
MIILFECWHLIRCKYKILLWRIHFHFCLFIHLIWIHFRSSEEFRSTVKVELSFPVLTIAFYSIRVLRRSTSNFQDGPSLYSSSKHNFPIGNLRTVVDTNLHLQFSRRKFCIVFPLLHELCLLDETPKVKHSKYAVLIHPLLNNANSVKKQ